MEEYAIFAFFTYLSKSEDLRCETLHLWVYLFYKNVDGVCKFNVNGGKTKASRDEGIPHEEEAMGTFGPRGVMESNEVELLAIPRHVGYLRALSLGLVH